MTGAHNFKRASISFAATSPATRSTGPTTSAAFLSAYTFTNEIPTSMTLFASRNSDAHLDQDLALFVQDPVGVASPDVEPRSAPGLDEPIASAPWDNPANARSPAYSSPARRWGTELEGPEPVPRERPTISSAMADGTQRRRQSICGCGLTGVAAQFGPTANFSMTRNWTDANANFFPDCDLKNPAAQRPPFAWWRPVRRLQQPERGRPPSAKTPPCSRIRISRTGGSSADTAGGRGAAIEQQLTNRLAVSATYVALRSTAISR